MSSDSSVSNPTSPAPAAGQAPVIASPLATLHPAYFAMVMATGIVSVAGHLLGYGWIAVPLLWLNALLFIVLWVLTGLRFIHYREKLLADLTSHIRGVGFFTSVAATCVLGTQFLLIFGSWTIALGLWVFGAVLWALLTYTVFTALTIKPIKPGLDQGIHGGWLVAVVAPQSVCVLGAQLASGFAPHAQAPVLFFCLSLWLGAGMLYIWIISLIFYRYAFFSLNPSDLTPPYWINMGAVAISTLAGTMLIASAPMSPVLMHIMPFLKGMTLFFWATSTWWIPMLLILGVWRHLYRRFPLRYDPLYWGAVFPLGMYTACTFRLVHVVDAPYLMPVPQVFVFIAAAAWAATFIGLLGVLVNLARGKR